jgi:type I restriction enzyme S subunit
MRQLNLDDVAFITEEIASKMKRTVVNTNDVLLNITGASIGRVATFELQGLLANVNQHVCLIRTKPDLLHHRYLMHFMAQPCFQANIDSMQRGGTRQGLTFSQIREFQIPLPSLEEQRRIAAILDKADAVRRKRKEAIALTEELLRSAFLEMFGDPVTNPKGWEVHPLGQLAHVTDGTHKTPTYIDSGVPFLSARNIRAHKIDWDNTRFISQAEHESLIRRCYPKRGDVLLTKSGTIGEVAVVDRDAEFSLFESVALLRLHNDLIDPVFLATLLNDHRVRCHYGGDIKGVAVKHLHLVDIKRVPVIVPPRKVQNMFLQQATGTRKHRSMLVGAHELYENLFNSLLQRAFRGEL